jgi:hypothetical protein
MTAKRSGATATEPEQARHTARLDIDHAPSWAMLPLVPWRVGQIGSDDHLRLLRHDGFTADNMEFKSWRQFIGSSRGDMACHRSRSQCHACTGLRCCGRPATLDFWDRVSVATRPTDRGGNSFETAALQRVFIQHSLQQKSCCRGLYNVHASSRGPVEPLQPLQLYSLYSSTALHPLQLYILYNTPLGRQRFDNCQPIEVRQRSDRAPDRAPDRGQSPTEPDRPTARGGSRINGMIFS